MFIAIRKDAAEDLISERQLQSADFEAGKSLAKILRKGEASNINSRLNVSKTKSGIYLYGKFSKVQQYIVIDSIQSGILDNPSDHDLIIYLQRILRFSIKYWSKGVLTPAEKIVSAKKAAIFPFPLSQKNGFRISIDLNPDVERLSKRGKSGRYLLIYRIGTDEGDGPTEVANVANFRKFLEELEQSGNDELEATALASPGVWSTSFTSTSLSELSSKVDIHQKYDTWLKLLTDDQKKFVLTPLTHPTRIDGPAGTGKTASLALAALHAMKTAEREGLELQAVFICHSEASRKNTLTVLEAMDGDGFLTDHGSAQYLRVETLQGYCAKILKQDLSDTEFVDADAYDAKQLQMMYVDEALRQANAEYSTYSKFISEEMKEYMENEENDSKIPLIQHEIAVVIKGRAKENLDTYKKIPPIPSGLPVTNEADKAFVWRIYEFYRQQLISGGQFDTDDVVLTALSQLSTPIWRRRKSRDGFDLIFVDEIHLFNMNELSVFHHLAKSNDKFPIAFAVDRSQAIGDRGWVDDIDVTSLMPDEASRNSSTTVNVNGIFRCSPDIVNLAFSITSSGASLFTNFQDPMKIAHSNMTFDEEKRSVKPSYVNYVTEASMIDAAFSIADEMRDQMSSTRGEIAIIAFTEELFRELERIATNENKPAEILKKRGDFELVTRARSTGRFVLSLPDYVGGLEFDGVVLVGVDDGRFPSLSDSQHSQSKAYMTFASHNKLYVAVTRARYQVKMLGVKARGPSSILKAAIGAEAISQIDA